MSIPNDEPAEGARKRILIVDDHAMMRQGMAQLINQSEDLMVCAEADDASSALSAARATKPDLVLADLSLPNRSGLELIKDIRAFSPALPVLVVSMHDETFYAERVLRAGGQGYLMKKAGGEELLKAIRHVLAGRVYVSEAISERVLESLAGRARSEQPSAIQQLTDRELEVFRLLGLGYETKEIADRLNMGIKTVEAHRASIKRKLNISANAALMRQAVLWVETAQPS